MNGQMYQICLIAAAAKKALKTKLPLSYTPIKYENRIEFQFSPEKKLFSKEVHKAASIPEWYKYCLKKGMHDIKLLAPIGVKKRALLGYSNTTQSSLVCLYKDRVTCFFPQWCFEGESDGWNVLYTEQEWKNASSEVMRFENNSEDFRNILLEIKEFAYNINCEGFAEVFQKALDILEGSADYLDTAYNLPLPEIPEENLRLFEAASAADVLGAMGSWNDSPPYMAHDKGLDDEYESLSDELLKQVRLAILFAINEW